MVKLSKLKIISISVFMVLLTINCATGREVKFVKKDDMKFKFNKILTMTVYDMSKNTGADMEDESNKIFGNVSQAEMANIYGGIIPGGELTSKAAESLKIKDKFDEAMKKITEAIVNSNSVDTDTTKIFAAIAEKMGVDAMAFPLVSGGKDSMSTDSGVTYRFALYNVNNPRIEYIAQVDGIKVNPFIYEKADDNQKKALISASSTEGVNSIFSKVKEEIEKEKEKSSNSK
jgi:hypothetical protein